MVVRLRSRRQCIARRVRADRERRARRHRCSARRPARVRAVLPQEGNAERTGVLGLMALDYVSNGSSAARTRRREAADIASFVRGLDWLLIGSVGALVAYGLWAIAGITRHDIPGNPNYYVVRQAIYASLGLLGLVVAVFIDPEYYRRYRKHIYAGTLGLMVIVLLAGAVTRGSKRWLDLGFFKFQPSEFGKLLLVLFLAGLLADRAKRIGDSRTVLLAI